MLYGKGAACVCEGTVQSDSSGAKNPVAGVTTVGWKSHGGRGSVGILETSGGLGEPAKGTPKRH